MHGRPALPQGFAGCRAVVTEARVPSCLQMSRRTVRSRHLPGRAEARARRARAAGDGVALHRKCNGTAAESQGHRHHDQEAAAGCSLFMLQCFKSCTPLFFPDNCIAFKAGACSLGQEIERDALWKHKPVPHLVQFDKRHLEQAVQGCLHTFRSFPVPKVAAK